MRRLLKVLIVLGIVAGMYVFVTKAGATETQPTHIQQWFDCLPETWRPGNACGSDNICTNPQYGNTIGYGFFCQPKLWYIDPQGVSKSIDWRFTCDSSNPDPEYCGLNVGYRSCETANGLMINKGYVASYVSADPIAPWHPFISWHSSCIAPWKIRWRYDPDTQTGP